MGGKDATERLSSGSTGIARAAAILASGGLVAVPTETVYGLAARADRPEAVAKIYAAKGRPDFNPLIVHVADLEAAESIAQIDDRARDLAAQFWPGPLTLVLPLRENAPVAPAVTAGLPTIAVRVPAHPVMRAVLRKSGLRLAAPSANRSGGVSPTSASHVLASLGGRIDAVIDGGLCERGIESTIVALRPASWEILRPGPVTEGEITGILGESGGVMTQGIEAPGQLASHYAPGKPVRLEAPEARADEFLIGFGPVPGDCSLSPVGDLAEAAARLYDCLHLAAGSAKPRVAVAPVPREGIGIAINDRLARAAA
jgi:L-threonylcarbamoyladenylate synthase